MPVAFDAVGTGGSATGSAVNSTSWSHTCSGANRVVVVAVVLNHATPYSISASSVSATYDGVAMQSVSASQVNGQKYSAIAVFALLNPSTKSYATVSISSDNARAIVGNSVSFTGVKSWDTATTNSGSSGTGTVSVGGQAVDRAIAAFANYQSSGFQAVSGSQRVNSGTSGTNAAAGIAMTDGGAGSFTVSQSEGIWGAVGINLVSAQNNWSGSASTSVAVSGAATGLMRIVGAASSTTAVTSTADGIRGTSSGASTTVAVTSTADGIRGTSSGASTTIFATPAADGAAGGAAVTTINVTSTADGSLIKSGTATTTIGVTGTATGGLDIDGSSQLTISATPTVGGVIGRTSSASTTVGVASVVNGNVGEVGGASTTIRVTPTADGTAGGSARTTLAVTPTVDGHVTYADGHLDLTQTSTEVAFRRANDFFDAHYAPQTQLDVRMHDPDGYALGQVGDYMSSSVTFSRNKPGAGALALKGSDPYGPVAMRCKYTVVPVTVRTPHWKWTGRVVDCYRNTADGVRSYDVQLIDDVALLGHIIVWPTWWSPIQFQPIKEAVYIGPAVTVIKNMISEQLMRLNFGLWEIVNNIINPAAWFATAFQRNANRNQVPYVVIPTDGGILRDTSKWTCMVARMVPVDKVIESTLKDCGLRMKVWMWEPGEPQPTKAFTLSVPTICIDVVDETNVQGLTGTALDGLIGAGIELGDTAFGAVMTAMLGQDVSNLNDTDATNPYRGVLSSWLGVHATPPWAIYEDGPHSAIVESHIGAHHPMAYTVIGGGKSPGWVNQLIDLLLEALLSAILAYAGISGISDTLLDGIFDDIILAFQLIEVAQRRKQLGRFGWPEALTETGGEAWTLNMQVQLESAVWDTRGQYTFQLITRDGAPYTFGKDLAIGKAASYIEDNVIYTDYLDEAVVTDDRTNVIDLKLTIGDAQPQESPWAKFSRNLEAIENAIKAFTFQAG